VTAPGLDHVRSHDNREQVHPADYHCGHPDESVIYWACGQDCIIEACEKCGRTWYVGWSPSRAQVIRRASLRGGRG
jgi:hypothetical protein